MSSIITTLNKQNNIPLNSSQQKTSQENIKKIIEKKYQDAYQEDMKKHKTGFAMLCIMAITGLTSFFCCKNQRGLSSIMGFGSLLGLLFTPVLKPKKEKYDAAMQKELNEIA